MADIKITLETLYDILRNEKKREDLQNLEDTFFIDVVSYLREKKSLLDNQKDGDELFAAGEKDKLEYELRSIRRILKELYEKREKKIIDIAMNKSRTGSDIIDTSSMLREEKGFYEKTLMILDTYRKGILLNLFKGELPAFISDFVGRENLDVRFAQSKATLEVPSALNKFELAGDESSYVTNVTNATNVKINSKELSQESSGKEKQDEQDEQMKKPNLENKTKIRFIRPMPSFVWKDMKVYGPFDKGEETEIFPEVADLIVRKGRAEKV